MVSFHLNISNKVKSNSWLPEASLIHKLFNIGDHHVNLIQNQLVVNSSLKDTLKMLENSIHTMFTDIVTIMIPQVEKEKREDLNPNTVFYKKLSNNSTKK